MKFFFVENVQLQKAIDTSAQTPDFNPKENLRSFWIHSIQIQMADVLNIKSQFTT